MRLLNTTTLQLDQVPDTELDLDGNQYAILSHRWGADEDEVSYEDMNSPTIDASKKKGFSKIRGFCELASSQGCRYGWVDTCCINKANSSELTEAINSMYLWYTHSRICMVYLEDVPPKSFVKSEWFDRGWTLQELIAPKVVSFFDQNWLPLGTKADNAQQLSTITSIPEHVLDHTIKPSACSIAQRMSWAAKRKTKRIEDRAYSLMGLFDVNMPMIYGERENAFLRLQQHIVQRSKDESLFAWAMQPPGNGPAYCGLYAPSPSNYLDCSQIVQIHGSRGFSENNGELSIRLKMGRHGPGLSFAVLNCTDKRISETQVFIILATPRPDDDEYVRVRDCEGISQGVQPLLVCNGLDEREVHVPIDPTVPPDLIFFGFWLRTLRPPGYTENEIIFLSNRRLPEAHYLGQKNQNDGITGIIHLKGANNSGPSNWSQIRWIKFGFDKRFNPVLWLANDSQSERLQVPFEQALASGVGSDQHHNLMKDDIYRSGLEYRRDSDDLRYDWPEGRVIVEVPRHSGIESFVIRTLDLEISVRLQPYRSPTMALSSRNTPMPLLVWVVDITQTPGTPDSTPPKLKHDHETGRMWLGATVCYIPSVRLGLFSCVVNHNHDFQSVMCFCTRGQQRKRLQNLKDDADSHEMAQYKNGASRRVLVLRPKIADEQKTS
jgi:hypothetical protein